MCRRKARPVEAVGLAIVVIGALVWMCDGTGRLWPYYLGGAMFGAGLIVLDRATHGGCHYCTGLRDQLTDAHLAMARAAAHLPPGHPARLALDSYGSAA